MWNLELESDEGIETVEVGGEAADHSVPGANLLSQLSDFALQIRFAGKMAGLE